MNHGLNWSEHPVAFHRVVSGVYRSKCGTFRAHRVGPRDAARWYVTYMPTETKVPAQMALGMFGASCIHSRTLDDAIESLCLTIGHALIDWAETLARVLDVSAQTTRAPSTAGTRERADLEHKIHGVLAGWPRTIAGSHVQLARSIADAIQGIQR